MKRIIQLSLFIYLQVTLNIIVKAQPANKPPDDKKIDLSGKWSCQLDSLDKGIRQHWYSHKLTGKVILPGSLTTNGIGNDITIHTPWTGTIEDSSWFHAPQYAQY